MACIQPCPSSSACRALWCPATRAQSAGVSPLWFRKPRCAPALSRAFTVAGSSPTTCNGVSPLRRVAKDGCAPDSSSSRTIARCFISAAECRADHCEKDPVSFGFVPACKHFRTPSTSLDATALSSASPFVARVDVNGAVLLDDGLRALGRGCVDNSDMGDGCAQTPGATASVTACVSCSCLRVAVAKSCSCPGSRNGGRDAP